MPLEKVEHAVRNAQTRGKPVSRVRRRWLSFLNTRPETSAKHTDEIKALILNGSQTRERLFEVWNTQPDHNSAE
jgi:hypothetical protein